MKETSSPSSRLKWSGAITGPLAQYLAAEVPLDDGLAALLDLPRLLEAARA